jgi:transcriptional regulator with XRE-family HTH domain
MARKREHNSQVLSLFAAELKAQREAAGWTQDELASKMNYSASLIASIETEYRVPQPKFAEACDVVFGTPGTFTRLQRRLRDVPYPVAFLPFTGYEAQARTLRWYEHSLVPGLLQTEEYARAVLSTRPNTTREEVDELVVARLVRQEVLNREDPPRLWMLIDEAVLHRQVGTVEVMRNQLAHLVELSGSPNITIQIVPYSAGGHSGLLGTFIVAEMGESGDSPTIVFLEDASDGRVAEDAATVSQIMLSFDALRADALPQGASRDLIEKVARELWS